LSLWKRSFHARPGPEWRELIKEQQNKSAPACSDSALYTVLKIKRKLKDSDSLGQKSNLKYAIFVPVQKGFLN
jgi:hypothetical protein